MSGVGVALGVLAAIALSAWAVRIYRRRELPVRGRALLAGLRVAVLLLVLLLVLDPPLPGAPGGAGGTWVLLDASLSMGEGEGSSWAEARSALPAADDRRVLRFGGEGPVAGLAGVSANGNRPASSRLTPALERAAESGARRAVVVTDLRLEDAPAAVAAARRLGLEVEVMDVGAAVRTAAVEEFRVPEAVEADAAVPAEVTVAGTAEAAGDSAVLEIREDGRLIHSGPVVLPDAGRRVRVEVELPVPTSGGDVRYEARIGLAGDAWEADDARVAWTTVDPEEGALVLLAVEPSWEPRFLLPVLGRVTGLRTRGFVRAGPDRWLVMDPEGASGTVDDARARREARASEMLVVQGGGEAGPPWVWEAFDEAPRAVLLASGRADAARAGLRTGPPVPGEWYASPDVPPSPLAAELSGAPLEGLPPLGPVLSLQAEEPRRLVPLMLRRGAAGPDVPALVLLPGTGRRVAVSLAPGHWRWAFRSDAGADAYRRLWAGVAGWLLAETTAAGPPLRPASRVVARDAPADWIAGAAAGDTVGLTLRSLPEDTVVFDTTVAVPATRRFRTPVLPPGAYAWTGSTGEGEVTGRFDVEGWTGEMLHPRAEGLETGPGERTADAGTRGERPLRTHPLPYILILGLLSVEWIGRRRRGLR